MPPWFSGHGYGLKATLTWTWGTDVFSESNSFVFFFQIGKICSPCLSFQMDQLTLWTKVWLPLPGCSGLGEKVRSHVLTQHACRWTRRMSVGWLILQLPMGCPLRTGPGEVYVCLGPVFGRHVQGWIYPCRTFPWPTGESGSTVRETLPYSTIPGSLVYCTSLASMDRKRRLYKCTGLTDAEGDSCGFVPVLWIYLLTDLEG